MWCIIHSDTLHTHQLTCSISIFSCICFFKLVILFCCLLTISLFFDHSSWFDDVCCNILSRFMQAAPSFCRSGSSVVILELVMDDSNVVAIANVDTNEFFVICLQVRLFERLAPPRISALDYMARENMQIQWQRISKTNRTCWYNETYLYKQCRKNLR